MRLFIAEKPSLGQAIAEGLGGKGRVVRGSKGPTHIVCGDDVVTWCFGHVYELLEPQEYDEAWATWRLDALPIVPREWRRKPKRDAKEQIKVIKGLLAQADRVVNAGDPDREGQLLVDEVLDELKNWRPVARLWLAATDEASVKKALASLKDNAGYRPLKDSAEARSWGDWLVGMNATRRVTLLGREAGLNGVLSVGRVQTPTLALVVKRDLEIESFRPKDFFSVEVELEGKGQPFKARWIPGDDVTVDDAGRVLDRGIAERVAAKVAGKTATCERYDAVEKTEGQPLAFSLDKLQMEANRRLGLSAQETLDVAQELYEAKLTSYPRTDCGYLPESMLAEAPQVLRGLAAVYPDLVAKASPRLRSATWNDQKVTAHHGIVPTGVTANLTGRSVAVYDLIARRYLAQFFSAHRYLETEIWLRAEGEALTCKGRTVKEAGWRALTFEEAADGEQISLPLLRLGDLCKSLGTRVLERKTTPPARFTEAGLLGAMLNIHQSETDPEIKKRLKDTAGIGTPATRAGIIETLKRRGFIEAQKKTLVSTAKGRELIATLPQDLKSPGLTGIFEQMLEAIAAGRMTKEQFLEAQVTFVSQFVRAPLAAEFKAPANLQACPRCKSGHLRQRRGSKGLFWGCSAYPACSATFPDVRGRPQMEPAPVRPDAAKAPSRSKRANAVGGRP